MQQLTEAQIRDAFVNASRKEVSDLTLLPGFHDVDWERRDYLGWTDPKLGRRAYAVIPVDGDLVAIMFERARKLPTRRAMCSWCEDVTLPNDVVFYSAKRTGDAGRRGDTVGTLVCAEFECSTNVRRLPTSAYIGYDREAAREQRKENLRMRAASFARNLRDGV
ncbi:translation elongation factor [Pseudoclavibacter sp. RFBJ3]|uniref:FBP domain-containing protein n=1 Tax=unclassified Pseudoclavibacter TaxID=2615177 RepID=UPI000CE86C5B|nr:MULTISPECIES: FBP domain-containing protein [unclassified Pseudoclavibacter]MBF4550515.1 FBP domain-containing protein [Pseudoclavibacter sp. VKM Ac-2888]PPF35385.1 translation elongation factor [Pseudoclavibacter sp. AY1H1]PPF78169.1 translation elongation factor [Pseudoclavibacter sp. Z016]PPF86602.1 translation elongation factor [Pseudoclavibacter sp. RFBJ5]PPF94822.1 translation elongation factor [Pseudoclavibacter sp. RFBH5]